MFLKPLANGLFLIFNSVICVKNKKNISWKFCKTRGLGNTYPFVLISCDCNKLCFLEFERTKLDIALVGTDPDHMDPGQILVHRIQDEVAVVVKKVVG